MKQQTPMSRLKDLINVLKETLRKDYRVMTLNKKQGDGYKSMPVVPDHVLIFTPRDQSEEYATFAFNYDFLDKSKEEHRIVASIKPRNKNEAMENRYSWRFSRYDAVEKQKELNQDITYSKQYTVEEFRVLIKMFTKKIQMLNSTSKNHSEDEVLQIFSNVFFNTEVNLKAEIDSAVKKIDEANESEHRHLADLKNELSSTKRKHSEATKKVSASLSRTAAYRRKKELEKELAEVNKTLDAKKKEYEDKNEVGALKKKTRSLTDEIRRQNGLLTCKINKQIQGLNALVKNKVFRKIIRPSMD